MHRVTPTERLATMRKHSIVVSPGKFGFVIHECVDGNAVKRVTDKFYPQRGMAFTVAHSVAYTYGADEVVMPGLDVYFSFALSPEYFGTQLIGGECAKSVLGCS